MSLAADAATHHADVAAVAVAVLADATIPAAVRVLKVLSVLRVWQDRRALPAHRDPSVKQGRRVLLVP